MATWPGTHINCIGVLLEDKRVESEGENMEALNNRIFLSGDLLLKEEMGENLIELDIRNWGWSCDGDDDR